MWTKRIEKKKSSNDAFYHILSIFNCFCIASILSTNPCIQICLYQTHWNSLFLKSRPIFRCVLYEESPDERTRKMRSIWDPKYIFNRVAKWPKFTQPYRRCCSFKNLLCHNNWFVCLNWLVDSMWSFFCIVKTTDFHSIVFLFCSLLFALSPLFLERCRGAEWTKSNVQMKKKKEAKLNNTVAEQQEWKLIVFMASHESISRLDNFFLSLSISIILIRLSFVRTLRRFIQCLSICWQRVFASQSFTFFVLLLTKRKRWSNDVI